MVSGTGCQPVSNEVENKHRAILEKVGQDTRFSNPNGLPRRSNLEHGLSSTLRLRPEGAARATPIIWCDTHNELYPPALAAHGISLEQLFLLHPRQTDQTWAIAECLRCKGVSVVVATIPRLSRIEARRLQLSAETGGGVGIFLRSAGAGDDVYAAATRWLVRPAPAERTIQRWAIQLIHGHGGQLGHTVTLEHCRENNLVRTTVELADRSDVEAA
jgi:hypothetical protein